MARFLLAFFVSIGIFSVDCLLRKYPELKLGERDGGDAGTPLFLTPIIESGNITEGQRLARVPFTENLGIKSYAGYFTVNKTYDSNQFFWYFPAMVPNNKEAPVIVWLQGGPGASSLYGLFAENGPISVRNNTFERRKYHWALSHHLIYIDNPVGTGFSFTKDDRGYCTDESQVGEQLHSTITQFFQLFPELKDNSFFITGESYAGKYAPALAYTIHKKNPTATLKINMKGIAIGDGWSDPEHQLVYGKYLNQIGLIDWNQANLMEEYEKKIQTYIQQQNWDMVRRAYEIISPIFDSIGFDYSYNYVYNNNFDDYGSMLQKSAVRKGIHVGDLPFSELNPTVREYLKDDFYKSVAPWISELLDHYNVLTYNGQLDVIVAYPLTVNYLRNLNFTGSEEYKTAKRHQWKVDGEVAGYVKEAGKLVEIMVRNAGHMVPADQPKWALDLITRFTHGKSFYERN